MRSNHRAVRLIVFAMCWGLVGVVGSADDRSSVFSYDAHDRRLPPTPKWQGKSKQFVVDKDDPWMTPAEASGFKLTATYWEVTDYLERLSRKSDRVSVVTVATLPSGNDLKLVVASTSRKHTAEAIRADGRPIVFIQAGIHPGEIAGSDAGLMLVRDLAIGRCRHLLDEVNLIFIPVLNVYGHELRTQHGRINQRGPVNAGWRSNARNRDLNRDFSKLDTPEVRAVVRILNEWNPALFIDAHTTDGMNYQYDVTWNNNDSGGYSSAITKWLDTSFTPSVEAELEAAGHIPGPSVVANDPMSPEKGFYPYLTDGPRYSNAYGDARQIPSILLETHALKPFEQRVLGAYTFYASSLSVVGTKGDELKAAISRDRAARPDPVVLDWKEDEPAKKFEFKGFKYKKVASSVSGSERIIWTDVPTVYKVDYSAKSTPRFTAKRPRAYWVAPQWIDVIQRLKLHGIKMTTLEDRKAVEVRTYQLDKVEPSKEPVEGRTRVSAKLTASKRQVQYPKGSVRVSTDQDLGTLAAILLEPMGVDSFFQWGFFNSSLSRVEFAEDYIMEALAEDMLASDPELKEEFETELAANAAFKSNPKARLDWFYKRTPFYDTQSLVYPVGIEE